MSISRLNLDKLRRILNGAMMSHLDRQEAKAIIDRIAVPEGGCVGRDGNGKVVIRDEAGNITGMQG